jgi:hypothetical protein
MFGFIPIYPPNSIIILLLVAIMVYSSEVRSPAPTPHTRNESTGIMVKFKKIVNGLLFSCR